jgi:hypothetical protein
MNRIRIVAVLAALIVVVALSGCGGGDGGGDSLNPAFAGTWYGTSTRSAPGYPSISWQGSTGITVSGSSLSILGVCPAGGGTLVLSGSGNSAQWTGSYFCPPEYYPGYCSSVVLTANLVTATLSADGQTVTIVGTGTGAGCGGGLPVTNSFVANKM